MSLTVGIDKLHHATETLGSKGLESVPSLVAQLRSIEGAAQAESLDELARLCRVGAETILQLAEKPEVFTQTAPAVLDHLGKLETFAKALMRAKATGGDTVEIVPPSLLTMPNADDEKHFQETVATFVSHAAGTIAELEEDILTVDSAPADASAVEAVGSIRRVVHTLKAEFGVLQMGGAQKLCHHAETAIDICTENKKPFPVDVMLELADWLKQYLERISKDPRAENPSASALHDKLRHLTQDTAATPAAPAAAADEEPIELVVGGEFADSLNEFISEARSHLSEAESAMISFENDGHDPEHINLTFRAFHTIKGVAGFLNLKAVVELAHIAETLLDEARSHRIEFTQDEVDLILCSGDMLSQMIAALEGQKAPTKSQYQSLLGRLHEAAHRAKGGGGPKPAAAPAAAAPAAAATATPTSAPAAVPAAAAPAVAAAPAPAKAAAAPAPSRVPGGDGDDEDADDGKVINAAPRPDKAPVDDHKSVKVDRTVKVNTTRLDMLVDMVGELVIAQSMVIQDPAIQRIDSQTFSRNLSQVGKITRDLQEAAMSLRMVTLKATFQKMARLVRDVSSKSGKKVALVIQGEDTELDRNVVEQISDPLVHMIRNSVDHGIEPPDGRKQAGKNPEGKLVLRAYHQGGSIVIEIADDGRGIDKAKIVKKAVEKGLLPEGSDPAELSDQEAFALIFLPGFSTADKVTDISGRGVGLDVVRRNIDGLRGKVEIESRLGEGTTFRMRLPLTLAIIDGMVVRIGRERYVLPTLSIEQSFRPEEKDVHYLVDRGECVRIRGTVLPIYRLRDIFGQADGFSDLVQGILIVVEIDGFRCCLFVDEILGQQQVVIKSLGMQGERVQGVSGGAIMGDGRVALILDVSSLVEAAVTA